MTYGCTRSHPHEDMDQFCELHTRIARAEHKCRMLELQINPEGVDVVYVYRLENGVTQVRAPHIDDADLVVNMLEWAIVAMNDGEKVSVA